MSTKLVRKQLLLDPQDLLYVDEIIKKEEKYTSFSQFVRELLKEKIQKKSNNIKQNKVSTTLQKFRKKTKKMPGVKEFLKFRKEDQN